MGVVDAWPSWMRGASWVRDGDPHETLTGGKVRRVEVAAATGWK